MKEYKVNTKYKLYYAIGLIRTSNIVDAEQTIEV